MTRLTLLAALALGLAAAPASAQDTPAPVDSVATDSSDTAIQPDIDRARALYNEARDLTSAGNHAEALLKYEQSLLYAEGFAPSGIGRAQSLAQLGRLDDSRTAFETAVAMAEASDASNARDMRRVARQGLERVTEYIASRDAAAAEANAAAAQQASGAEKLTQARNLLGNAEVSAEQGAEAIVLLDGAVAEAGYNASDLSFDYAKAYIAAGRYDEAIPYAQAALDANPDGDRSAFYVQLGLAYRGAGQTDDARAAFQAVPEGQSWHGWAQHYLRELDADAAEG